jgi:integrase/recombinase XerD
LKFSAPGLVFYSGTEIHHLVRDLVQKAVYDTSATNAAFAEARSSYLEHLAKQGHARATLRAIARDILGIAERIEITPPAKATIPTIEAAVDRWMRRGQRTSPATRTRIVNTAKAWLQFSDLFAEAEQSRPYAEQVKHFTHYMRDERGLAQGTIASRLVTLHSFLSWLEAEKTALSSVALKDVDCYLASKGREVWKRRTVATNARTPRAFFLYAEQQEWCIPGIAAGIELPRIYGLENLPLGPSWEQVRALLASTNAGSCRDLRDRAALLLFAVYGLRCSEVRRLRLEDIDWNREILSVRRAKCRKTQEFPLTREVGDALIRYLQEVRAQCQCREVFITLKAPWRPVSHAGFYDGIRGRLDALGIDLAHRGPHSLRHACATHLLTEGLSLKEIGDHLGHRSSSSTSIYAKVDMTSLREVAELDFGDLR